MVFEHSRPICPESEISQIPGLAPGVLGCNRFLDVRLADGLQLLILRGAKNLLQLRRVFTVEGMELPHLLHSGK